MEVEVKPASAEELDAFLGQNRRWIPDDAEKVLRGMSGLDQRRVISGGTMSSVQNPVAVIQARVRKATELEAAVSRSGGKVPAVLLGLESKLIKPATEEDLDGFIKANDRWLGDEAVQTLRSMSAFDQRRVISAGTMSGCRDPVAVIQTRAKKAREMEMELENLAAGKGPLLKKEKPSQAPAPSFDEEAAAMHLYAPPEEVFAWESRFAPPPIEDEDSALVGESPGVGGVVEILKAKYGCSKGQRIRVIGETHSLLQFEGGKTAPKNHEDSGWKWVIREEEEVKQSAAQAQMAALKQAAAAQLAQVEAAKAAELARAQAEAKAYAAAQQEAIRSKEHAKPKQKEPKAPRKTRRSSSSSSSSSSETEEKKHRHQKNPKKGIGREKKARSTKAKKNKKEAKSKAATRDALSKSRKTEKKKSEEKRKAKKAAKVKKRKARSSSSSSSATDVTIPGASEA
ncbi:unnamed protein product [Cladocopium goreaui]|uniref:Uncharacterized protein n=1 Tax=Cladocopium goreaui TaxID=2562237 RepID=A0A9P1C6F9_9DINO|nr:unnamed protein product [Cladocopium goreaui]|mmetsp:Transcript_58856/g.128876  ORF Transcript_58856/g.128876 Transcript_58856/m.128876 type:complete len:456 (-) Transcript_58856:132-1499(-)